MRGRLTFVRHTAMAFPPAPRRRLAFALDVPDLASAQAWIEELAGEVGVFKVGLELFTAAGPEAIRAVHDGGAECFLDLKLHDIPATTAGAVEAAAAHGVRYLTVHASAGPSALQQAATVAQGTNLRLLAVTVLTSLEASALEAIGLQGSPDEAALRLAAVAQQAGIPGLVTSARECAQLRNRMGADALLAVPGVRPLDGDTGDQRRIATPGAALQAGADLLVVGRPIREAMAPVAAARAIVDEIAQHATGAG